MGLSLCFTDGRTCGATLDRNGLRPLRVAITDDGLVTVASEAGAVPLPEGSRVKRARLGPGGILVVDPVHGLLLGDELRRELARRRPYGRWVASSTATADAGEPVEPRDQSLDARHVLHGYTREELNTMLRPLAQTGHDPVSSMGDDASIAPLAGRARPFSTYLRQRFAQVTNPAIDHLRERLVMSVATLLGPRVDALGVDGPPPRLTVLPGFLLYPSGLESLSPCGSTRRSPVRRGLGERSTGSSSLRSLQSPQAPSSSASPTETRATSEPGGRDPRSLGRAHATGRSGPPHALLAARGVGRAARHAYDRVPPRLRR